MVRIKVCCIASTEEARVAPQAGGLHARNVAEAINTVLPFGVDLCSAVRTDGKLDPVKLHDFMVAVRSA